MVKNKKRLKLHLILKGDEKQIQKADQRQGRNRRCLLLCRTETLRSRTCLGNQSDKNWGAIQLTETGRRDRESSVTFFVSRPWLMWLYMQYSTSVCVEKGRHYFHFHSRATQHPPQSARWPKPCANPRSCSLMCPRKHTHTHTESRHTLLHNRLWCHQHWTYISLTHTHTHTCMRLYFVHRDIRINRFVKLGLSSHIHRNHGIRCINACHSWICIRQWCATRTEDYFWQTLLLSLALSLSCAP